MLICINSVGLDDIIFYFDKICGAVSFCIAELIRFIETKKKCTDSIQYIIKTTSTVLFVCAVASCVTYLPLTSFTGIDSFGFNINFLVLVYRTLHCKKANQILMRVTVAQNQASWESVSSVPFDVRFCCPLSSLMPTWLFTMYDVS